MPSNVLHHFVPKSYLKNFATREGSRTIFEEPRTIRLLHIASGQIRGAASIRDQCRRKHYYGEEPELEKALSGIEGEAASIIREAIDTGILPRQMTMRYRYMFNFIATQIGRTESAEAELNALLDTYAKYLLARIHPELDRLDRVKIGLKRAVIVSLQQALIMSPTLWDLHYILLDAQGGSYFITSDNPVVVFNCFYGSKLMEQTLGLGMKGMQLFMPICPTRGILFYDPTLYKPHRIKNGVVPTFPVDVRQFNALTYLNASANVYWSSAADDQTVADLHGHYKSHRVKKMAVLESLVIESNPEHVRERIAIRRSRPEFEPNLNCLRCNQKLIGVVPPGFRIPEWMDICRSWYDEVVAGKAEGQDFFKDFVVRHPLAKISLDQIQRMSWNSSLPTRRVVPRDGPAG